METKKPIKKSVSKPASDVNQLKKENKLLKEKVNELDKELQDKKRQSRQQKNSFFKQFLIFLLSLVAVLSLFLFNLSFWVKNTITDTDTFVATLQPLISDEEVNKTLSTDITNAIFSNVNVDQVLKENLPANIAFLAGPLSGQIKGFTESQISKILDSPQASEIWTQILTQGQSSIMGYLKNPENQGTISVNQIYQLASKEFANTPLAALANRQLPERVGNIQVAEIKWLPEARQYLNLIERLPIFLVGLFVISAFIAIVLSRQKRTTILNILSFGIVTMFVGLGILSLGLIRLSDYVKPDNVLAAEAVYNTLTAGLQSQLIGFIWLLAGLILFVVLTAQYPWLKTSLRYIRNTLDRLLAKVVPNYNSPNWINKVGRSRFLLEFSIALVLFIMFAFRMPPKASSVGLGLVLAAGVIIVLEFIASLSRIGQNSK